MNNSIDNNTTLCPNMRNDDRVMEEQMKKDILLKSNRVNDLIKTTDHTDKETLKRLLFSAHMRD